MTEREFIKDIYDYFSFLEDEGGPAMDNDEMHLWLKGLLDEYIAKKQFHHEDR